MPSTRSIVTRTAQLAAFTIALAFVSSSLSAQPFGAWLTLSGSDTTYIEIPHSSALNPTAGFTFEAWVDVTDAGGCSSIAGKGWSEAWWVGVCGTTLRSYLHGSASQKNGGTVPAGVWTHIAVTWDGSFRRHFIDGVEVGTFPDTTAPTTNSRPLEIASDPLYHFTPAGAIDEVRLWNVARTTQQLRASINKPITAGSPGLVGVWGLNANANDALGAHNGAGVGAPGYLTFPVAPACVASDTTLCLDHRFGVSVSWRDSAGRTGIGHVAPCGTDDSGLFWFFNDQNWEILVKSINACGLNERYWIYSAATTDVFYRLGVFDIVGGANKIYFNYLGTPAPAVTDSDAFATCP
ncbi:MAG: LamG domain-containing protein [Thermoanaerobaculia bacterium]